MDNRVLEQMIREVMESMASGVGSSVKTELREENSDVKYASIPSNSKRLTVYDYPLIEKRPELIKTPTDKSMEELTLKAVVDGNVTDKDLKIRPETLFMQAQIAESANRKAFANNLRRAAELINVPDEKVLEIYNCLRPNRSSKEELLEIAKDLETNYNCKINSALIREAAEVYDKRDILRRN